jgi:hypothetical protein
MISDPRAVDSRPMPVVCRHLRSKGAGVVYGDPVRWESGYFPNAVFWCLTTVEPVGPDDGLVHPHACIAGRACFCDNSATTDSRRPKL